MYDVNDLPSLPVYEWDRAKKRAFLDKELTDLTDWHAARCPQYARMRDAWPARGVGMLKRKSIFWYLYQSLMQMHQKEHLPQSWIS